MGDLVSDYIGLVRLLAALVSVFGLHSNVVFIKRYNMTLIHTHTNVCSSYFNRQMVLFPALCYYQFPEFHCKNDWLSL